jgi:putative flippase GtrA
MDLSGLGRSGGLTRQGLRFTAVGSLATATQLGLYALMSGLVGAQVANITAWLVSTMVGNAAQQRFTFQVPGARADSDRAVGLITSLAGLGASSLVLALLAQPDGLSGTIALIAVNTVVGALRFFALRWWFTDGRTPDRDRGRALLSAVQSVRSMLVSAPPRISTSRRSLPLESSTK